MQPACTTLPPMRYGPPSVASVGVEGSDEEAGMGRIMTGICRRWSAVLAMVMVAPLLALTSGPAVAVDGKADNLASYTACVGDAIASAGFVDTLGHFAEEAIDCLGYYGITLGTTPERFSPNQPITRWQMALFLVRAAVPAGVELPEPSDQGFEDLDRMAPFIRDAINQVAAMGITRGTSPTTFSPTLRMDRRSMALFIYRFLSMAPAGPGGADATLIIPRRHRVRGPERSVGGRRDRHPGHIRDGGHHRHHRHHLLAQPEGDPGADGIVLHEGLGAHQCPSGRGDHPERRRPGLRRGHARCPHLHTEQVLRYPGRGAGRCFLHPYG